MGVVGEVVTTLDLPRFGQDVFLARRAKGWHQADLAEEAGVSMMTVRRVERPQGVPTLTSLEAIAGALGLRLSDYQAAPQTAPAALGGPTGETEAQRWLRGQVAALTPAQAAELVPVVRDALAAIWARPGP
jgi:transcriptional regulator with XRE-family HTH domain